MDDQTNPRRAHAAAKPAAGGDRSNRGLAAEPSAAKPSRHGRTELTEAGVSERSPGYEQTNPKALTEPGIARRSADDRTHPSAAAKRRVSQRGAKNSQTSSKTVVTASAATHSAESNRRNPRPAAKRGVAEHAAVDNRTNPVPKRAPARASATDDRTNLSRAPEHGAAERSASGDRTNPKPEAAAAAAPARLRYDDAYIKGILQRVKTIAAVGMSANDMRPSYFAMLYLQQKGYRMIPVNPRYAGQEILGEKVVASLDNLPAPPDMVQIFRKSDEAPAVVDEAIRAGAKVVWLQLGIRSDEAAARARAAGLDVVMDRCPKIEYGRLFGEIGWAGVNRRVISAKKGQALQLSHKKGGLARRPPRR
jgi:predicted CoA-binding protein